MSSNPYVPPQANLEVDAKGDPAAPIWNPGAAASWSLLFSPVFGALVQMKNWQALGKPEEAERAKRWAITCAVILLALIVFSVSMPESKSVGALTNLGGFVLLVTWYLAEGRKQMDFVSNGYGKTYTRRGWGMPLLCGIGGYLVAMAVGVVAAIGMALMNGELQG
jgi:hypothetical protein